MRFQERFGPHRGAVYVDGYNLYHRIHECGRNYLKWLNLSTLGHRICSRHDISLTKVVWCTAIPDRPADVKARHETYRNALTCVGVDIVEGHHVIDRDSGKRNEKESDINLALSLMRDAYDNAFDCAYILSSDSDQAATARFLKRYFPHKYLIGVSPPSNSVPTKIQTIADAHFDLTVNDLEWSVFRGL
jgi:uncharacterized LabA/DUF88 family protein